MDRRDLDEGVLARGVVGYEAFALAVVEKFNGSF
jgi:hypothetical protein